MGILICSSQPPYELDIYIVLYICIYVCVHVFLHFTHEDTKTPRGLGWLREKDKNEVELGLEPESVWSQTHFLNHYTLFLQNNVCNRAYIEKWKCLLQHFCIVKNILL